MSAWPIPRIFEGKTVAVVAGGPSATKAAIAAVRKYPRIAVRNAYQLALDADALLSLDGDAHYFEFARAEGFRGLCLTGNPDVPDAVAHWIGLGYERVRIDANTEKEIRNSGLSAIRTAADMGAVRILTVGIDPETPGYAPDYLPGIQKPGAEPYTGAQAGLAALVKELAARGVIVEPAPAKRAVEAIAQPVAPVDAPEQPSPAEAVTEQPSRRRRESVERADEA